MQLKNPVRLLTAAALALTAIVPAAGLSVAQAETVSLPGTIPSLSTWNGDNSGVWTKTANTLLVGAENVATTRELFSKEVGLTVAPANHTADADDIELRIDASRTDLQTEGYELKITADKGITITGGSWQGVFYGTRTLGQMLRQQASLPTGSAIDIPKYKERGITACACQINIQPDWIDRLLTDMADLKLNHLLLEMKLKSDRFPNANTWSYYTREDVSRLVEKAAKLGIEVIPEINSPGHMGIWLENFPQYQLVDMFGERHPEMLDISNPEAVQYYLSLVDEYKGVFKTPYWHVGGDEYMINTKKAYYPRLAKWAQETYGPGATIDDAFIGFINKVNEHVKKSGGHLRMWNDGVIDTSVVTLNQDIIVEFWYSKGKTAKQLVDSGAQVMNANDALYWSRSNPSYKMNPEKLWNQNWSVANFPGRYEPLDPNNPLILGAKASIWPDSSIYQTENEVEEEIVDGTRFIAQMTWTASHDNMSWTDFKGRIDKLGRNPLWNNLGDRTPVENGTYTIKVGEKELAGTADGVVADGVASDAWTLTATPDHYYQLRSDATGKCLALSEGTKHLDVVTEVGAKPSLDKCADSQLAWNAPGADHTSNARNTQKWQLIAKNGSYVLRNALTNQDLSLATGSEQHVDLTTVENGLSHGAPLTAGTVVQLPSDMSTTTFTLTPGASKPAVSVTTTAGPALPGQPVTATITVSNRTAAAVEGLALQLGELPGWKATITKALATTVPVGESVEATVMLEPVTAVGTASLPVTVTWTGGQQQVTIDTAATCGVLVTPTPVDTDSQELKGEGPINGRLAAAFDGNPDTFWHTQWEGSEPGFPHWVTMKLDAKKRLCGLQYTPRTGNGSGVSNGWLADYKVYVSDDGKTWGEPVATGRLKSQAEPQTIAFDAQGQYVKLEGLSSVNDRPNMSAAEIGLRAGEITTPEPSPTPTTSPSVEPTTAPTTQPEPEGSKPAYVSKVESGALGRVLKGDWDGDGTVTYAVRVGTRVVFYNENRSDAPVYASVSLGRAADELLVGDWDGDGKDTLALRRGTTVLAQTRLTSSATTKVMVEGITAGSKLAVRKESGKADVIVVVK
ncbi:Sialidase precursor [Actinomyces bovis]|uniref:Sialidase n=1 Tax=Actinomyces bovis TaxID=1658 RepID=A0ABY1VLI3_9ACTO|nr:family 20 glycosylhydrolase [Actinomyces bovis]SPT52612.1 Sialidase precursor [Actinomyces bovis]VEG54434.1 Sialidase precursor [Actinomyces israelii]